MKSIEPLQKDAPRRRSDQRLEKDLELAKQRRKADNALALDGNH